MPTSAEIALAQATAFYRLVYLLLLFHDWIARENIHEIDRMAFLYWGGILDRAHDSHVGMYSTYQAALEIAPYPEIRDAKIVHALEALARDTYTETPRYWSEYAQKSLRIALDHRRAVDTFRVCDVGGYLGWYGVEPRRHADWDVQTINKS